jgi:hypothetical protein
VAGNTVSSVAHGLNTHEKICAERYKRIEERLASGDKRFTRLENMIWGLYLLIFGAMLTQIFS